VAVEEAVGEGREFDCDDHQRRGEVHRPRRVVDVGAVDVSRKHVDDHEDKHSILRPSRRRSLRRGLGNGNFFLLEREEEVLGVFADDGVGISFAEFAYGIWAEVPVGIDEMECGFRTGGDAVLGEGRGLRGWWKDYVLMYGRREKLMGTARRTYTTTDVKMKCRECHSKSHTENTEPMTMENKWRRDVEGSTRCTAARGYAIKKHTMRRSWSSGKIPNMRRRW
jgi:hypothetical protein